MGEIKPQIDHILGLCIKNMDGEVISQNEKCIEICGQRTGKKCDDGCIIRYRESAKGAPFDRGAFFFTEVESQNSKSDILVVNDGNFIVSVLSNCESSIQSQIDFLEKFNLTKAELRIVVKMLHGLSNREIAAELFICKGTLRTHLGNIYKKIPKAVKEQLVRLHSSRKK